MLEFDHRDVSDLLRRAVSWSLILAEISKCDVVCANCRRQRTARTSGWRKLVEFDHLGGTVAKIAEMVTYARAKELLAEIDKCQVLCANCHRRHTAQAAGRPR